VSGVVDLVAAGDALRFGGKAASLARLLGAGLPAPDGFAIDWATAAALDAGDRTALAAFRAAYRGLGGLVAVRSSAVGEDGAEASFAGQHLTILGAEGESEVLAAIFEVHASSFAEHALAYRRRAGDAQEPRMGVVVQRILDPSAAGVLFTRNPVTGADERVVEAAWGLGEAVVAALVAPDRLRFARGGAVLEHVVGRKPVALRPVKGGQTRCETLSTSVADAPCLDEPAISALDALAQACETLFAGPQDIEWALVNGQAFLLQSRPITTLQKLAQAAPA
jgi:pyruvate,water dikinase